MKLWLLVSLPLYLLDQITKALVRRTISTEELIPIIPGFLNLVQVHNTGAAFGVLRDNNLARRNIFADRSSRWACAVLVAGVAGNLTDRLLRGHVVDFIDVILPWYGRWPAFNVADSCICVAAGLFVLGSFLDGKRRKVQPSLR